MGPILPGTIASWDGYGHITRFVNYSQLVHPTSIGFRSTAILYFDGNELHPGRARAIRVSAQAR
jgi:hypothetical protein